MTPEVRSEIFRAKVEVRFARMTLERAIEHAEDDVPGAMTKLEHAIDAMSLALTRLRYAILRATKV